jgi:cell division protein FtsW (lipid II flippase)
MEIFNILFQSFYFKLGIAAIMALLISFANEVKILHDKFVLILIFLVLILMLLYSLQSDVGIIMLLVGLFVICYNLSHVKRNKQGISN